MSNISAEGESDSNETGKGGMQLQRWWERLRIRRWRGDRCRGEVDIATLKVANRWVQGQSMAHNERRGEEGEEEMDSKKGRRIRCVTIHSKRVTYGRGYDDRRPTEI